MMEPLTKSTNDCCKDDPTQSLNLTKPMKYNEVHQDIGDSPIVEVYDAIEPNKRINLFAKEVISILAARFCCGAVFTYGLTSDAVGQRYSNTISASTSNAIQVLNSVPGMFVFFLALYMENKPLFGTSKKYYILLPLFLAHVLILLNGVLFSNDKALVVQWSNLEGVEYRGRVQVIASACETAGSLVISLLIGLGLSGPSWTASQTDYAFDFELSFLQFSLIFLGLQSLPFIFCCAFVNEPESQKNVWLRHAYQTGSFYRSLVTQIKAFQRPEIILLFWFYICSEIPLYVFNVFQNYFSLKFVGSTAFVRSLNGLFGMFLVFMGLLMLKKKIVTMNWKVVYFLLIAGQLLYDSTQFIFYSGHLRNPYAYFIIGDTDVIERVIDKLLYSLLVLEVSLTGQEASTVALFDTVIAIAQQISCYLARAVGFPFNGRALGDINEDTDDSRLSIMK
eukprot:Nk52_evm15s274 gene=Nk52_evmTU15s274